jgi:hemoglobin-like flavoprotein
MYDSLFVAHPELKLFLKGDAEQQATSMFKQICGVILAMRDPALLEKSIKKIVQVHAT